MKNKVKKSSIKNWSEDDRPREKMMAKGASALSISELLSILIGSGSVDMSAVELSRKIMLDNQNDLDLLSKRSVAELTKYKGIGQAKAISIVAAMELVKRRKFNSQDNVIITSSREIFAHMYPIMYDLNHEEFWIIFLNRKNKIIHKENISKGGVYTIYIDPKIIFKIALNHLASSIILVHNHPSENPNPSDEDKDLTTKIKNGAELFDMV